MASQFEVQMNLTVFVCLACLLTPSHTNTADSYIAGLALKGMIKLPLALLYVHYSRIHPAISLHCIIYSILRSLFTASSALPVQCLTANDPCLALALG